jgi:hypothetical protein
VMKNSLGNLVGILLLYVSKKIRSACTPVTVCMLVYINIASAVNSFASWEKLSLEFFYAIS